MKKRFLAILLLSMSIQVGNVNAKKIVIETEEPDACLEITAGLSIAAVLIGAYLYLTQN